MRPAKIHAPSLLYADDDSIGLFATTGGTIETGFTGFMSMRINLRLC